MRERADSIGATVDWTNPSGGGCRVRLALSAGIPVPAGADVA
jgi:signal transduction histidine kinase